VSITRRFRHVLEHAQALLDGFLPGWGHVPPAGQHFVSYVIALLWCHLLPDPAARAHILLLLWR
jgi:hypothetical protein